MSTFPQTTATARTLRIWLLTNLGGTSWLVLDFCRDSPSDIVVPLIIGVMAALLSLAAVPLAIPLFAVAQRYCTGWSCRFMALAVVVLGYAASSYLLLILLPIGPISSLLSISQPYLVATVLAVMWAYRPNQLPQHSFSQVMVRYSRGNRRVQMKFSGLAH
ncbi:hypothetical protein [Hymenobacter daeguensis]